MKNTTIKNCPICNENFRASKISQKFCSDTCRQTNFRVQKKEKELEINSQLKAFQKIPIQVLEKQQNISSNRLSLQTQLVRLQKEYESLCEQKGREEAKIQDLQNGYSQGYMGVLISIILIIIAWWLGKGHFYKIIFFPIGIVVCIIAFLIGCTIGKKKNAKMPEISIVIEKTQRNIQKIEPEIIEVKSKLDLIIKQLDTITLFEADNVNTIDNNSVNC